MIGQTLGHYRIVEKIGKGGMGVVYRARDQHLDRDVALKVLPAGTLADEAARQRFRKEARALSRLNHPNIQTVHDFDTQDGLDFLVTEYVPGVTLNERLAGQGLPEKEVLRLGQQLAEGLAAAHEQGIIHRDLKPSNLRVTPDGRLKILDFGVAKLLRPSGETVTADSLTAETLAGTPLYMAPEQKLGEPVDARTDIYAAGWVLREMATGQLPPRPGESPPPLVGVSSRLQQIIEKCLEKDAENRYQSARELAVDLRRVAAPTPAPIPSPQAPAWGRMGTLLRSAQRPLPLGIGLALMVVALLALNVDGLRERLFGAGAPGPIDSIAVLPLKNLMGDPEQEYFVEGMHEALTAELSKISALKVISRTSAMRYKGTDKPMPQIARELGVAGVIEGSVLREGDQVRITVQLIHGPTDKHLWAQSYQRELRGILALQSEVARAVAQEIRVQLTPQEQVRLASARPANPEAYDAYLSGLYYFNQYPNEQREEPLRKSIEFYEQAIRLDPGFAPAYAGLGTDYQLLAGYFGFRELRPKARAAVMKALELDDGLAEAHRELAFIKYWDWDWAGAERESRRAIELKPSYSWNHSTLALCLTLKGRYEEAVAEFKRAEELDPLALPHKINIAVPYDCARQYDPVIEQYRKTLALSPNSAWLHNLLGGGYVLKGMYEEAFAEFQKAIELSHGDPRYKADLAWGYAMAGEKDKALKIVRELKQQSLPKTVTAFDLASIYAALGDKEQAFGWLEKADEEREIWPLAIKCGRSFDGLRDDPRFQDLLRRMNFPED